MAATPNRIPGEGSVHIEPGALEAFRAERESYFVLGPFRGLKRFLTDLEQASRPVFCFAVVGMLLTFTKGLVLVLWCVEWVTR